MPRTTKTPDRLRELGDTVVRALGESLHASRVQLALRLTFDTPCLLHPWRYWPPSSKAPPWYRNTKGVPVLPCRIVKAVVVEGARSTGGLVTTTRLRNELRVLGHTAPLRLSGRMRLDHVTYPLGTKKRDIRTRGMVPAGSSIDVVLEFPLLLAVGTVIAAVDAAGVEVGFGDWRPLTGGEYGVFHVDVLGGDPKTIQKIHAASKIPEEEYSIQAPLTDAYGIALPRSSSTRAKE